MATQSVRLGSMVNAITYDDGAFDSAVETTQPIKAGTPIDGNDVVRLDDLLTGVTGPAASTDEAICRFDGVTGKIIQNSIPTISDTGVVTLGDGGTTNYIQFAADGELNLFGTARVIKHVRVGAGSWQSGVNAPVVGILSTFPVLKFDAAVHDDAAHYSLIVPQSLAAGTAITVMVDWCHEDGGDDTGTCTWGLEYRVVAPDTEPGPVGELVTGATTTIYGTSIGDHIQHELVRTTLATGIVGAVAHELIGLRLFRDIDAGTLAVDADLIQVHFMYIADKLGHAT